MGYSTGPVTRQEGPPPRRASGTLLWAVLAVGLLLGFTLGLIWFTSLDGGPAGSSALYDEDTVTSLFESASPAVVEISVTNGARTRLSPNTFTGSGFLIDHEGHIITNNHVVDGAQEITVMLFDGRVLDATRLGTSPADDLAVIQVDRDQVSEIAPLTLADSADVRPGQLAVAVGSPFRQFNSVTVGVVSGTGRGPASVLRRPMPDMIQTDAPLNPGNSGGPLLNSNGEVIGVNSAVRTGSFQGIEDFRIGFAVPSNTVRDLMPQLLSSERVRRPWLGISGAAVTRDLTSSIGVERGVYITGVIPDSPAHEAGLVPFPRLRSEGLGDVITAVDGQAVGTVEDMVSYFNRLKPGNSITLSILRDRRPTEVEITLGAWPDT